MSNNKSSNKNKEPKIQIEVSLKQADIIQKALDLYSRIGMCQFDNIKDVPIAGEGNPDYYELESIFNHLHQLYCPELQGGYYGIFHKKTPEQSKIAWDIQQVMRHDISWYLHPEGNITVDFDKPFQSAKEDLCKCKIISK